MLNNSYKYFCNRECKYYPCHKFKNINCLFCYCPIYLYECGGNFKILKNGIKDCSECEIPHKESSYDYIINFLEGINYDNSKKT